MCLYLFDVDSAQSDVMFIIFSFTKRIYIVQAFQENIWEFNQKPQKATFIKQSKLLTLLKMHASR
jgi:hypothetical protein